MKDDALHPSHEELFAYRDGELPHEKKAIVEAHVMGCGNCRSLIDEVSSLEAELRRAPDGAPAEYLERLPQSVRERITDAASREAAPARASWIERRRAGDSGRPREVGGIGAAPKLPWAAVLSTATAATAVVVVVVILVNRGALRRAVSPLPPPAAELDRALESSEPVAMSAPAESIAGGLGSNAPVARISGSRANEVDSDFRAKDEAAVRRDVSATRQVVSQAVPAAPMAVEAPTTPGAPTGRVSEEKEGAFAKQSALRPPGDDYDTAVRELGLRPMWDGSVSPAAIERAEPRLRLLYRMGKAGSDSARVRLYLAEAARLRYAPRDSALHDQIVHHYRRAIRLAGLGSDVARVAAERLRTLEILER